METSCRDGGCRDMRRVSGRTPYFVNSGEVASDEMLLITLLLMTLLLMMCLQELFFRLVTSDALLQMHIFICISSDALSFKLISFAL